MPASCDIVVYGATSFVAKHVFRESSQNCRYAMKFLSMDTIGDPNRFCTGAADLVVVSSVPNRRRWSRRGEDDGLDSTEMSDVTG